MSWIVVRVRFVAKGADGKGVAPDEAQRVVDQVRTDALFGTFSELEPAFWQRRMERTPETIAQAELLGAPDQDETSGLSRYTFELRLSADFFPPTNGGLQHLIGILAGDLLNFVLPPTTITQIQVLEISLPDDWRNALIGAFRNGKSNSIIDVRRQFGLDDGMPLVALSFKPRVGFQLSELEAVAREVLKAGFNLVEIDTRFLAADAAQLDRMRAIAARLADENRSHVGRLSLNISLPPDLLLEQVEKLIKEVAPPVVCKIDGGLDGLSGLQALRRRISADANGNPVVATCYPLIGKALKNYVPPDIFVRALSASGADIIYPGGRPDIGKMVRSLGDHESQSQISAVERYRRLVREGWPMPSIAGGIYAGQLQAFYEVLGPDTAWFLGGGVALHKDGPAKGAELCMRIARESANLRHKAGVNWAANLPKRLPEQCEEMFANRSSLSPDQLKYVSPQEELAKVPGLKPYGAPSW